MADRYEILLLEPIPTGVEHMGAVEMTSEPREQTFTTTFEAAIADAERFVREWRDAQGTSEAWHDAYEPLHALSKMDDAGGETPPFGSEGLTVMVRPRARPITDPQSHFMQAMSNGW